MEKVLTALECQAGDSARMQWRTALTSPLEQAPGQMLLFINQIVSRIGTKVSIASKEYKPNDREYIFFLINKLHPFTEITISF